MPNNAPWSGQWVADRLGVALHGDGLHDLVGLALRRNPKRAHLLVSRVLGKHVPQAPDVVYGTAYALGRRVRDLLGAQAAARVVVLGYAETATGLGHAVADGLGPVPYLHSTRRRVPGLATAGTFEEEHSHATGHLLLPRDPALLTGEGPLVLVDDEFSTGQTVLNTIRALHARAPRAHYVVVALTDLRPAADRDRLTAFAADLGARIDVVALATGRVTLPDGVLAKGQALVAAHEAAADGAPVQPPSGPLPAGGAAPERSGAAVFAAAAAESLAAQPSAVVDGRPRQPGPAGPASGGELPAAGHGGRSGASAPDKAASGAPRAARVHRVDLGWPAGLPDGGRHGFLPAHRERLEAALPAMGRRLAAGLEAAGLRAAGDGSPRVLVLGTEELMYAPLRLAQALQAAMADPDRAAVGADENAADATAPLDGVPGAGPAESRARTVTADLAAVPAPAAVPASAAVPAPRRAAGTGPRAEVRYSTTTRSPVLAVDDPGYAIRSRLVFPAHDEPDDDASRQRYAYNIAGARFDAVVCVVDSAGDTPALHDDGGLLAQLAAHTDTLLLAVVPSHRPNGQGRTMSQTSHPLRGPAFSSYAADEVGWLLKDLSDVELEAPTEEREEAIQSGGAHYAESLPVEYQPSDAYQALFRQALAGSAQRIARAVGTVTELVVAERGPDAVLVSLARAGTPVGVLMRRWARHAHGLTLPHYAVSIVRGRGIDRNALRWLAAHHDPADAVFVDGWTGKGAITRELAEAVRDLDGFNPDIAVLADPGGCVSTYGTRDDFLIPSACLNSTVSGLISRTVLRAGLIGPDDFHGAKFYRDLAGSDVSGHFLDTVTRAFDDVADGVAEDVKALREADRTPTWAGWAAVERISEEYGIGDVNLVKPGVGETTRVLLRRVPWRILARRGAGADLDHVRLLAAQRGVPVEETDDLPYSCVGLIHPRYTRGATGTDGKAVAAK